MAIKQTEYLKFGENLYEIIPPLPSGTDRGGIIASPKESTDTVEIKLGENGKLYAPKYPDLTETIDNLQIQIDSHNTATDAHNDIRDLITGLTTRLNTLADSDDTTLDQMSEVVAYIKSNKSLIDSITTSKVNVSDIVDNLTTNVTNKPLSAAQGVVIKSLIDALQGELNSHGHDISDVSGLQSALDGKAPTSHGTHVTFDSTNTPKMDGTAAFGTSTKVARADHVHPTDTSRAAKTELDALSSVVAGKAPASHDHTITASASDDDVVILTGTNGTNQVTYTASHAESGVTAGTYKSVTVNKYGHVTGGTNPTTLAEYGITDAAQKTHTHEISDITNLQTTLNNAASAISTNISSIDAHTQRIESLEEKVGDGFEFITSADIQALFA